MKILFIMRNTVYVRNFESTLRLLAERGHQVQVAAPAHRFLDDADLIGRLTTEHDGITYSPLPDREPHGWALLGESLRRAVDYLRYLGPAYSHAPKLRARAERTAPSFVTSLLRWRLIGSSAGRRVLGRLLRLSECAMPRDPTVDAFVHQHAPDLLLVTPLVEPGSPQAEYVRSARALGIRTGLCVYSWDNLTNKGLIQDPLDIVTVWNEAMRREAITLHDVPAERVVVTGSPAYDHWFSWTPRLSRETFCAQVGLRNDRPYLLYLCSSNFIAPDEVPFVRQWVHQLRESSEMLGEAGVLVRPHPQNADQWKGINFHELGNVSIWPPAGRNPVDSDSRSEYYDSIYHSAAVVGVNTSALIESAIVGRKVYTLLAPEFRNTQEGTLHFHHLREVGGGLLHVANDFAEHVAQLEDAVRLPEADQRQSEGFLRSFVRPFGLAEAAAPKLVDALERVAAQPPVQSKSPAAWEWVVRRVLTSTAAEYERAARSRREQTVRHEQAKQRKAESLAVRRAEKEIARERARQERRDRIMRRREEKTIKAAARAADGGREQLDAARAFENYQVVREHVTGMRALESRRAAERSASEQRMLAALQHIWDATPEVVANLRHHTAPIAGIRPAEYVASAEVRKQFFTDLNRLVKVGNPALLVPEPAVLGGFGHSVRRPEGERQYNDETLKHYEVLSALECGAVLGTFQRDGGRDRIVWEIGGGWGGFAYQFKTLFPNVTYVITAPPELLLFSAVYLMTVFPYARCRFFDDTNRDAFWRDLASIDFAFATERALQGVTTAAAVDLTLDLQAVEQMPGERACAHIRAAFALRSRYIYSLCPADHQDHPNLTAVSKVLERLFWSYELPVPQYEGMKVLAGFRGRGPTDGVERVHRLGWRRIRV